MSSETIQSDVLFTSSAEFEGLYPVNNNISTEEAQRERQENLSLLFKRRNTRRLSLLSETTHDSLQRSCFRTATV